METKFQTQLKFWPGFKGAANWDLIEITFHFSSLIQLVMICCKTYLNGFTGCPVLVFATLKRNSVISKRDKTIL